VELEKTRLSPSPVQTLYKSEADALRLISVPFVRLNIIRLTYLSTNEIGNTTNDKANYINAKTKEENI